MSKELIIYFSRADENYAVGYVTKGNTEIVAEYIQELTGADMFKVERKIPYARDYQTCIEEAQIEKMKNKRPELTKELKDINAYQTIYIGAPIYWGGMPQPMFTQLEKLDWNGKTVYPFTTHEGSGLANVMNEIKKMCVGATIKQGLAIKGSNAKSSKKLVEDWLKNN